MRNKIFSLYFILVFIVLMISGIFSYYLAQHFYKNELEERLTSSALLIGYHILEASNGETIDNFDFNHAASIYSELLSSGNSKNIPDNLQNIGTKNNVENFENKVRITFIDYNGNVLGESDSNHNEMENHFYREEVQEAIQGRIGKDIRYSGTIQMNFLYVAVPVAEIKTIVRLSLPLSQIQNIYRIILGYELLFVLLCIVLSLLIAFKFSSAIVRPVKELITKSREIAQGNYAVRAEITSITKFNNNIDPKHHDEIGQLAATFNEMASKLESTVYDLKNNNLLMDTILNSMTDAIIAVNNNMQIILINSVACKLFEIPVTMETSSLNNIIGSNLLEFIRINQLHEILRKAIDKKIIFSEEISLEYIKRKILRVTAIPVKPVSSLPHLASYCHDKNLSFPEGALLSIQDITNIKKLEQIRTDFVSNVTHELKTPLTSIRGFIETLRNGAIKDEAVAENFLHIIDIEAERLYSLINDILQLSEIESGKDDVNKKNTELGQIIKETVQILKPKAEKHDVSISLNLTDKLFINANKDRIKQMLINLIDNGIKYNKKGGNVSISAYQDEGKFIVKIADNGIGIPKEHLPRIFERFYRVDKGRSRSMGGTGLGLAIVKHIVNLYNGNIIVNSELGKGTEFVIQLPRDDI